VNWICQVINSQFSDCLVGMNGLVDAWVLGGAVTSCVQDGVLLPGTGTNTSSTVNLMNTRVEWNCRTGGAGATAHYGINFGGTELVLTALQFDANGQAGVYITGDRVVINGCNFTRNGVNNTSGTLVSNSGHLELNGAYNIMVSACTSRAFSDGTVSGPKYWTVFDGGSGNNGVISFNGNDLTGYTNTRGNTGWYTGSQPTLDFICKLNFGTGTAAQDVDTR
jgi:hypothetical protein